ncbi:MAG TPA: GNAT family N-acetyltransferase [Gaiellaceae bacterium]|nr:GNAT family N-acetyltransferase [Gaiellaceae bacterium]
MSISVRNARREDAEAAAEVLNEHSRRLHGVADTTPAELEEDWRAPEFDFPADVFVAESDGVLVGYADAIVWGDTSWLDVRGTDEAGYDPLLAAVVERAAAQGKANVRGWANQDDRLLHEAYARARFEPIRHSFRMEVGLKGELPEPSWPEGFAVRPLQEGDERRVYRAQMDAFADTWGFTEAPFETWSHWALGEHFQPEHWFVVESGDDVAAIAECRVPEAEPEMGWVDILGVPPAYRRRGLATALLQHVFRHFAARGLEKVGLSVDAENPTGAVRLYERAGMHVARTDVRYQLVRGRGVNPMVSTGQLRRTPGGARRPDGDTASGVSEE